MSISQSLYRRATQLVSVPAFQSRSSSLFPTTATATRLFSQSSSAAMSSTNSEPKTTAAEQASSSTETNTSGSPLALPAAEEGAQKLDVSGSGGSIKLDHLGPLVVNQDGSLSRISNWDKMTEIEKKNTLRVLGKRNQLRMDALKAANNEEKNE